MIMSDRLRALREHKQLSQGDIEKRTGLLRCYISRVENGHTVPSIETLEKMARALEVAMYELFYEGEKPPEIRPIVTNGSGKPEWGSSGKSARFLRRLCGCLGKMDGRDRALLMLFAQKAAQQGRKTAQ